MSIMATVKKRIPPLFFVMLFSLYCVAAPARAGDETKSDSQPKALNGGISLGWVQTSGNTDTQTFNTKGNLLYKRDRYRVSLAGQYVYAENEGVTTAEKVDVNNRWELRLNSFFSFWDIKYYRNPFQKYDYRLSTGPGLGYYFYKTEKTYLSASYYVHAHQDHITGVDEKYLGYTVHNVEQRFRRRISEGLKLREKIIYSLTDRQDGDYFIDFEVSLKNKLTKHLALEISYEADYQNKPVDPTVKRLDTTVSTYLVVSL